MHTNVCKLISPYIKDDTVSFRYEMRFNLKNGLATEKKLSVSAVDFPRVNESYTGR